MLVVLAGCLGGAFGDGASNPTPESEPNGEFQEADHVENGASSAAASDGNELDESDDEAGETPTDRPATATPTPTSALGAAPTSTSTATPTSTSTDTPTSSPTSTPETGASTPQGTDASAAETGSETEATEANADTDSASTPADAPTETPAGTETSTPGSATEASTPSSTTETSGGTDSSTSTPTETESSAGNGGTEGGASADESGREGDVDPDNPYGSERLTVAVDLRGTDREARPLVKQALAFWEANAERHAGYPIEYELVERGAVDSPDVVVTVTDDPLNCGWGEDEQVVGCAPWNTEEAPETTEVEVRGDLTDQGLYEVLVHELGHTLGLGHTDEPQAYMAQDRPTGAERADTTVLVETEGNVDEETVKTQVDGALGYYERGADGTLASGERPEYELTDDPAEADLIITVTDDPDACPDLDGAGSCFADGEYRDQTRVVVAGIENDAVGYYAATLLAHVYYDDASEIPHPVSGDATSEERSGQWWTDG